MKPTNPGSRRQKIILYYILAVVLPGIILGYMAYRGIRNDQALREKESLRRLEINSQTFFSAIDRGFVRFMNEQAADSMPVISGKADPSLLALFVSDSSGSIKLIYHQLLYLTSELMTIRPEQLNPPTSLEEGIHLEFAEQRFSEALRFYQGKVLKTTDPIEKIQSVVASARLYNKMNQPYRAKDLYEEIRKDYPGRLLNGEIPLGLIAGLEILKINRVIGDNDEMRNNSRQYLEFLLHPPCEYDKNQFDMFYQSFKDIIRGTDPEIDSLIREVDIHRVRTDFLIQILRRPDLIATSENDHFKGGEDEMACIPFNSNELAAVYLARGKNKEMQTCMVIDFQDYLKSNSNELIQKLDPNSSINIKIEDNNGRPVFSRIITEGTGYLSFPFPENLPQWKLLLSEKRPGFVASLMKAGSGIYLFAFILIAIFMLLGFIFILYTLNIELRLNKLKSEFISNVSHELKSPLTSIRMMTEMLHHNRVESEERKSAYYSAMLEESEHLSHLIDNILDFSRIEDDRKKYDFVDVNLDELLKKFLNSTRESLPEPGFDIRYNSHEQVPLIKADQNAILQVFYNLVDNAIKFSGTSTHIDINLFSRDDELLICVKDYGIGISPKDQEKIFDRFYRGEEPHRLGIRGSGIGLTIVKKNIEAHNGYMTIESKPGEGSLFCVHLPINKNSNHEKDFDN
ncbi:MAG: HAMP domain-containing histidine kinase [Candidatus Atribacteria bacterium]|nr:MAG: HAMP domain-containing histidine kinase [Candidatus Atribacteria bacterium]